MRGGLKIVGICFAFYCFSACLESPEFSFEEDQLDDIDIKSTTNIGGIIKLFEQSEQDIYTISNEDSIIASAFVISSDESGNFYKTLIVQDLPENPSNGLEIKIDLKSYYSKYNFGRKLLIDFGGLSIQEVNGKYIVGYLLQGKVEEIPEPLLDTFLHRSQQTEDIVPVRIKLEDFSRGMINTFIELQEAQFSEKDLGKTYSSEISDAYNGERIIEQCTTLERTILFSSVYVKFKTHLIPDYPFHIKAVLSTDNYSGSIYLMLNQLGDIKEAKQERCDPKFFECTEIQVGKGEKVIFYENFDTLKNTLDIERIGWKNLNVNFGNAKYRKRSSNENSYVQVSAYNTDEYVMDAWLISPEINLSKEKNVTVSFDTRATFEEGTVLTLWISTDYSGDFFDSNWQQVKALFSIGSRDGANKTFQNSGLISLTCLQEEIHIAFRYLGADPGISTTYDLDNILIVGDY